LHSQENEPQYEAISYCWGSNEDPSYVCVDTNDGKRISITHNLDDALRNFRYANKPRLLWADALCINQFSVGEKNRQVAIMGRIYSNAKRVLIWVGPERDGSDKAIEVLQHMSGCINYDWNLFTLLPKSQCRKIDMHWSKSDVTLPYENRELNTVLSLFERPYFSRTWVRQETYFAQDAVLHCGRQTMVWDNFRTAVACIHAKGYRYSALSTDRINNFDDIRGKMYDLVGLSSFSITYSTLRSYFGNTQCRDPHDKIYAALSILDRDEQGIVVTPDYSCDVEELYTDVARRVIVRNKSLELFCTCFFSTGTQLPSWVPDWSSAMPRPDPMSTVWSACGWISAHVSVQDDMSICVAGVEVAQITSFQHVSSDLHTELSQAYAILRKLRPLAEQKAAASSTGRRSRLSAILPKFGRATKHVATKISTRQRWSDSLIMTLTDNVAELHWPRRTDKIPLSQYRKALETIWSSSEEYGALDKKKRLELEPVLRAFYSSWQYLCLFHATNGHVGLVHSNVHEGDVVCMLLGIRFPVVLRRTPLTQSKMAWKVVSVCCVPGLMGGELIYGTKLPSTWEPVIDDVSGEKHYIECWRRAFHDTATHTLRTNPAEILAEVGIKVESYQRKPHRLEVLPETLRSAGIPLRDFILV
jgi:hypothetical protein